MKIGAEPANDITGIHPDSFQRSRVQRGGS